ncbi:dihydropteroate synthase [Motiliproteus coralliicola]|uniref:Dihydropteroate synthase n=1 Tax=Motiliproteus coralliicola TaxID=2283196 RepID=A0A369W9W3_9GAMM|nr:dihydropteroate synthase [Motiliproteus coralliicola]RDE18111.1 dihydropteroate synthase [Motiliproteus coralliicola]
MSSRFRFGTRELPLDTPQVMGILNVTPDSFSDGGQLYQGGRVALDDVLRRASAMVEAGATLLDVGGESTRPGADPVSEQQELDRVVPVVEALSAEFDVVVSVDTSTASVIQHSAAVGAGLINDVRALQRHGALEAAAATGLPVCLMHMQGQPRNMQDAPEYRDVVTQVAEFLEQRMQACTNVGIDATQLILDPGFGFGKTLEHNLLLLQRLDQLQCLGAPLLVGISRKSMIGAVLDKEVDERLYGSLAAAALALVKGAWILRVHDVAATQDVAKVCQAVMRADV